MLVSAFRKVAREAFLLVGRSVVRLGMRLLLVPYRREKIEPPNGSSVSVLDDLVEYTGLDREQVVALIERRHDSFRTEWHAFPPAVRREAWFYLASRTYLFANAVHDPSNVVAVLSTVLPNSSDVLDFGGGTGNLALALAAAGHRVDYLERSALQKDFVRFRVHEHGFEDHVRVVNQWSPLEKDAYDAVCAIDVLEHLESLAETLEPLLASIRPGGLLVEDSPFVRSIENPMHHESEAEFVSFMRGQDFVRVGGAQNLKVWARHSAAAAPG